MDSSGEDHFAHILEMPFRRNPQRGSLVCGSGGARWQQLDTPMETLQDALAEHPHVAEIMRIMRIRTNEYAESLVAQRKAVEEEMRLLKLQLDQSRAQALGNLDMAYEKETAGQAAARRVQADLVAEREAHQRTRADAALWKKRLDEKEQALADCTSLVSDLQSKLMVAQRSQPV